MESFAPFISVMAVLGGLVACCSCFCCCSTRGARDPRLVAPTSPATATPFIQPQPAQDLAPPPAPPPSGIWRGYYEHEGSRHPLSVLQQFSLAGVVTGGGVDDVGGYEVRGNVLGRRIQFYKTYQAGSLNEAGFIHEDNEGHTVYYQGEYAGYDVFAGFQGTWSLRNDGTSRDGTFHLWPAMEATQLPPEAAQWVIPAPSAPSFGR